MNLTSLSTTLKKVAKLRTEEKRVLQKINNAHFAELLYFLSGENDVIWLQMHTVHATTFICTDTVIQPIVLVYKGEISVLQTNALSTRRQLSVFHWKYELNLLLQICSFLLKYFQADILLMFFLKKE